jgi:transposase
MNICADNTATLEENIATTRAYMKSKAAANARKIYGELNMDDDFVERAIIQKACRGLDSTQISEIQARLHEPQEVDMSIGKTEVMGAQSAEQPVPTESAPVGSAFVAESWERVAMRERGESIEEDDLMKTLSAKRYTVKELAGRFGCSVDTIERHAKKLFGELSATKADNSGRGRPAITFDEAQVTLILEAMKQSASSGAKSNLLAQIEGIETGQSLELQIAIEAKKLESLYQKALEREKANRIKAEAALGRLTVEHQDALTANTQLFDIAVSRRGAH